MFKARWIVFFILFSSISWSQTRINEILIDSDEVFRDLKKKTVTLKGNVHIKFKDHEIYSDQAHIEIESRTVTAQGKVKLKSKAVTTTCEKLEYHYDTETGRFDKAHIQSGQVSFEGDVVHKVGEVEYIAQNAKYTACSNCPPAWSFTGKEIQAELGGYAYIKVPILRVADYPVFLLPAIIVPLKSQRQSGLLVPNLEFSSSGGTAISQSYFWAISRSQDMTIAAKNYEKRGLKGQVEYRYVLDEGSKGDLQTAYIEDRSFEDSGGILTQHKRWFANYSHHYELPDNFSQHIDIKSTSDLRYMRDFSEELEGHGDPAMETRISLTKNWEKHHLSLDADYYVNTLKEDPLADNHDAVHRLPEIKYSITDTRLGDSLLLFRFDSTYTSFSRNGFSYDDIKTTAEFDAEVASTCTDPATYEACKNQISRVKTVRDGSFDPSIDLLRTGQRFDFHPNLALPFRVKDKFDVLPSLTYRETHYRFNTQSTDPTFSQYAVRRYLELDTSVKTQFRRVIGHSLASQSSQDSHPTIYEHKIEPEIRFAQVIKAERPNHAFFGNFQDQPYSNRDNPLIEKDFYDSSGNPGGGKVQFDYNDRLFDKKLVNFSIVNRITRKMWENENYAYKNIVTFGVSQYYDFKSAERTINSYPWSGINVYLDLHFNKLESHSEFTHFPYARVANSYTRFRYLAPHDSYAQIAYSRQYDIDENRNTKGIKIEHYLFELGWDWKYLNLMARTNYSLQTNELQEWNYLAHIKPPGNCWGILLGYQKVSGGDRRWSINLDFKYDGDS